MIKQKVRLGILVPLEVFRSLPGYIMIEGAVNQEASGNEWRLELLQTCVRFDRKECSSFLPLHPPTRRRPTTRFNDKTPLHTHPNHSRQLQLQLRVDGRRLCLGHRGLLGRQPRLPIDETVISLHPLSRYYGKVPIGMKR